MCSAMPRFAHSSTRCLPRRSRRPPPPFVLHGLEVDGTLRAVTGSSRTSTRIICEFGTIADDDLAHASPGDFLFFENIAEACRQGLAVYDFSVGDEPYKRLWCDLETRHFDVIIPLSAKGRLLAWNDAARRPIKGGRQEQSACLETGQTGAKDSCRAATGVRAHVIRGLTADLAWRPPTVAPVQYHS